MKTPTQPPTVDASVVAIDVICKDHDRILVTILGETEELAADAARVSAKFAFQEEHADCGIRERRRELEEETPDIQLARASTIRVGAAVGTTHEICAPTAPGDPATDPPLISVPDKKRSWVLVDSHVVMDKNNAIHFFWFWREASQ